MSEAGEILLAYTTAINWNITVNGKEKFVAKTTFIKCNSEEQGEMHTTKSNYV